MQKSVRIFLNTGMLYIKLIIATIVNLYLMRIVLDVLGVNDFGIYNLIAGVVALLSFLSSALASSTQRFLSVAIGEKNTAKVNRIYSASVFLHLLFSLLIVLILEIGSIYLFDGFLNIPVERLSVAKSIYQLMTISVFFTVFTVPWVAVIYANEDLWFYAIVEISRIILRLCIVWGFAFFKIDALFLYSLWILITTVFAEFILYLWCKLKYSELKIFINETKEVIIVMKEMLGFTSWNTLGSFAMVGRNQGVAVLLNVFFSTAINAVYGIANQVNAQLVSFSQTMTMSMTPQIMKSKGEGNIEKMLFLSFFTSKLSFFLSAVLAIPFIVEMDFVLNFWLKDVPAYTEKYCGLVIYLFLIMQLYTGFVRALQADGRIKIYQIVLSILLLLPLLIGSILFKFGFEHYIIVYLMIIAQILILFFTISQCKKLLGFQIVPYMNYLLKTCSLFTIVYYISVAIRNKIINLNDYLSFCIVVISSILMFSVAYYIMVFNKHEKKSISNMIKQIIK